MKYFILFFISLTLTFSASAVKEIHVDKQKCVLRVIDNDKIVFSAPVCVGKNKGQKKRAGDHKTPEGTFKITSIENSSGWDHDFRDGKGKIKGAYGPWFFRLNTPQSKHIGIHGTCFPNSVGTRSSDGCVRLRNSDLKNLKKHVKVGMKVIIHKD
ncbi:MAG: L,D-transpeptidase [Muribaculaceae bacterium]|nr:L,D-transpeptidase [Muribaculaceae bacterium]